MAVWKSPQIPGEGVKKDSAEKRGFIKFFILFWRAFSKLVYCGCLTLLLNLLIIPAGLGEVGMARIARLTVRNKHAFSSDYFDAIKSNWKQALISGLINNILFAFALFSVYNMVTADAGASPIMLGIAVLALVIVSFIKFYTPAIMLTFNVTISQLYKNAIILSFVGFARNLIILIGHLLAYAILLLPLLIDLWVGIGISICLYLLFIPAFSGFLIQYNIFPVMYKYMIEPFTKNHPNEGEKTLRELGLIETESEQIMEDRE